MSRLLMTWEGQLVTADILQDFLSGFEKAYDCRCTAVQAGALRQEELAACDILLCVRGESPWLAEVMKKARQMGKLVLYFLDDDLKDLPETELRFPARKKYLLKCLQYAQGFLTSNLLLAQEYLPLIDGDRFSIVETAIAPEEIVPPVPREEQAPVRLVYAGAATHAAQWNRFLAPIWPQLAEKYAGRISLTFVGMHPVLPQENYGVEVTYVPPMNLRSYRNYMCTQHFDVGLAPLQTNHFSERKYYNKFLEYTKYGICGVYSAVPPYTLVVRDGENGVLAENRPEAWLAALERLIDDAPLRQDCVQRGQALLAQRFTRENIYAQLSRDFPELTAYTAPPCGAVGLSGWAKIHQRLFRLREVAYLTVRNMQANGWEDTWRKIQKKIKE